jgi:heme a synthase
VLLHRFACFVSASTLLLIVAGGMVTSTGAGLAVPDWPSSYGYFMFSFPWSFMVGGIFYEHGHRLIASLVGMFTIVLAGWLWWKEPRPWVRRLGFLALGAVVLQGVLGGITVLFFLPTPVSVSHAGLAQIFFCLTVTLALVTSPGWRGQAASSPPPVDDATLRRLGIGILVLVYAQIIVGAVVRHTGAGLAIPDFPLVFGGLLPPDWTAGVAVHYAHRAGAGLVTVAILASAGHIWHHHRARRELTRPAAALVLLVAIQIALGGLVVLTGRQPAINTAHVAGGSLVLATSLILALRAHRLRFADVAASRPAGARHASSEGMAAGTSTGAPA